MNFYSYLRNRRFGGGCGVSMDGKPPRKATTYRDRYYAKYRFKRPQRTRPPATAQDWASGSLAEHDARFHPDGYHPWEGERCSLRATLKKMDAEDLHEVGQKSEAPISHGVTAAMDARYAELFEEYERCEAKHDKDGQIAAMKELREMFDRAAHLAFRDSVVKDEDDMPKVVYHGTTQGGFTEFDTDGKDKTKDTGAWFANERDAAFTYSGKRKDVELPRLTVDYLIKEGYLTKEYGVIGKDGKRVGIDDSYPSEQAARDNFELEEGERIGEVWVLENPYYCSRTYHVTKGDALDAAMEDAAEYFPDSQNQDCIYTCFLNITDPETVNAEGENWDNVVREWHVYGPDGDFIDGAWSKEEAEDIVAREKADGVEGDFEVEPVRQSTDELVRDARLSGAGYDGFIISNISDAGPYGGGYYGEVTDYIAFKPGSIKLSDVVTFDDFGNVIPLSRRFDFSNPDIRY